MGMACRKINDTIHRDDQTQPDKSVSVLRQVRERFGWSGMGRDFRAQLGGQAEEEELCTWEMDVYGSLRGVF
tara:strand:+ start:669 stop:884 length:216 start_codon:yes stop_codon:yes gene_type:complete